MQLVMFAVSIFNFISTIKIFPIFSKKLLFAIQFSTRTPRERKYVYHKTNNCDMAAAVLGKVLQKDVVHKVKSEPITM